MELESLNIGHLSEAQLNALIEHVRSGLTDMEPEFRTVFDRCKSYTMTSDARMYAMYNASQYIVRSNIPGAIVECGVWKGGSIMVSALALLQMSSTDREIFLYDTYEGLPKPTELDVDLYGTPAGEIWQNYQRDGVDTLANCSLDECSRNVLSTGYPEDRIHFVKGLVEDTIPANIPEKIALLRLDTDWHSSVAHVLNHVYDRISPGGAIIIDDYGHFAGARKAVDDFLAERNISVLLNRIDYTGRLFLKPS